MTRAARSCRLHFLTSNHTRSSVYSHVQLSQLQRDAASTTYNQISAPLDHNIRTRTVPPGEGQTAHVPTSRGRMTSHQSDSQYSSDRSRISSTPSSINKPHTTYHSDLPQSNVDTSISPDDLLDRIFLIISLPSRSREPAWTIRQAVFKSFILKHAGFKSCADKSRCDYTEVGTWRGLDEQIRNFFKESGKAAKEVTILINGHCNG